MSLCAESATQQFVASEGAAVRPEGLCGWALGGAPTRTRGASALLLGVHGELLEDQELGVHGEGLLVHEVLDGWCLRGTP